MTNHVAPTGPSVGVHPQRVSDQPAHGLSKTSKAHEAGRALSIERAPQGASMPSTAPSVGGTIALQTPPKTSLSNPAVFAPVKTAAEYAIFDILALAKLLIELDQKNYESDRTMRQQEINSQVALLKKKAKSIKKEGATALITAAVKGGMEIGAAGVKFGGSVKGASALRNNQNMDIQARSASSQAIQMRWGAMSETVSSSGTFSTASGEYIQKTEQSKQTTDDAEAQRASSYVSILGDDMQRFYSSLQSIMSTLQEILRTNSDSRKKSYF